MPGETAAGQVSAARLGLPGGPGLAGPQAWAGPDDGRADPGTGSGSAWGGRSPDDDRTDPSIPAVARWGAPPQRADPYADLRPRDEPWPGPSQPGHPYPVLRGQHHRAARWADQPDDDGDEDDLPRRSPRIAHIYGNQR
jgi:hypothetical protein